MRGALTNERVEALYRKFGPAIYTPLSEDPQRRRRGRGRHAGGVHPGGQAHRRDARRRGGARLDYRIATNYCLNEIRGRKRQSARRDRCSRGYRRTWRRGFGRESRACPPGHPAYPGSPLRVGVPLPRRWHEPRRGGGRCRSVTTNRHQPYCRVRSAGAQIPSEDAVTPANRKHGARFGSVSGPCGAGRAFRGRHAGHARAPRRMPGLSGTLRNRRRRRSPLSAARPSAHARARHSKSG